MEMQTYLCIYALHFMSWLVLQLVYNYWYVTIAFHSSNIMFGPFIKLYNYNKEHSAHFQNPNLIYCVMEKKFH